MTRAGPPKGPSHAAERPARADEAEDDPQHMLAEDDDGSEAWARKVGACEDRGLD